MVSIPLNCSAPSGTTYHDINLRVIIMDATAIGAIASVIGSIVVFVVLGMRIRKLMNTCNSQD